MINSFKFLRLEASKILRSRDSRFIESARHNLFLGLREVFKNMAAFQRSFEYQALHGTNSIRVIKIFPALKRDSPIIIDLSEFTLNSSIEYEALSYTWDDQKPTRDITCNEKSLFVTDNIFQAIRQLRSRKARKRMLWIDAICINQKDQAEKTSQVSMMGNIYARAQRVNVWLSHSTEAMRAAFEYVRLSNSPKLSFDHVSDSTFIPFQDFS